MITIAIIGLAAGVGWSIVAGLRNMAEVMVLLASLGTDQ